MKRSTIIEILSSILILVFVYTGLTKAISRSLFESQMLKSPFITYYAWGISYSLPYLEMAVALLLLFQKTRLLGLYLSYALLLLFTEYIAGMLRYADYLPCSCGGIISKMDWNTHLLFNTGLLALSILGINLLSSKAKPKAINHSSRITAQTHSK